MLLTLGADPTPLYVDGYGKKALLKRITNGTICEKCYLKYKDFLDHAKEIYDAQFNNNVCFFSFFLAAVFLCQSPVFIPL